MNPACSLVLVSLLPLAEPDRAAAPATATAPSALPPALLVLMHTAGPGEPKTDPRMNHFALPDPKLAERLRRLGFQVGVCGYVSGLSLEYLKRFNVVVILHPHVPGSTPAFEDVAAEKKKLVLDYVKDGGGLLVLRAQDWQFGKDIDELNRWLGPLGIEIPSEQVVDEEYKVTLESGQRVAWTDNLSPHPVTEGVKGLFYTTDFHMYSDSTSPVKAGPDWTVLVRGKRTARSLRTVKGASPPPASPGTYAAEPPLLAVRSFGRGRVAVWPINATLVWQDGYHVLWGRGVVMEGQTAGLRGDAARLLENLLTWLAEPSRGRFGGYVPAPAEDKPEVGFERIDWDRQHLQGPYMPHRFVGLIGAKSHLSSGSDSPEAMIQAAREAGYDFIAFAEDLDRLTPEKFQQLAATCQRFCGERFKAYPGFAYLDESGNSWVTFSPRLCWPEKGWWSQKHPGRIGANNPLSRGCQWPPVILIKAHANPEKPCFQGNFKVLSLYTYEGGRLVDEALDVYRRLQKERFQLCPVAVHLVRSAAELRQARTAGFQTWVNWYDADMIEALSGHYGMYRNQYVFTRSTFVSEGPFVEDARIINFGTSDLALPENDRFRLHVRVTSAKGLREVALLDADAPRPWRRFLPAGQRTFEMEIDHFHDRQYDLIVRAVDLDGKTAIGWSAWTAVQENSFPRCSDNINTMPHGKWAGTPKDMFNVRGIENYLAVRNFGYVGLPAWHGLEEGERPAVEYYPRLVSRFGTVLDCLLYDHYPSSIDGNPDRTDRAECAKPNTAVGGHVRHTLFTPWQDGPLVVLVEGDFTARQDFTLQRAEVCRFHGRSGADSFCATLPDGTFLAGKLTPKAPYYTGELPVGGFAAVYPQPFTGSVGLIALAEGLRFLAFGGGTNVISLRALLGPDHRPIKAGDKLAYRYLAVTSALDPRPDNRFVTDLVPALGLHGRTAYQVKPSIGSVTGTCFVLNLKAADYGFAGTISQAALPLHLPACIAGLNPRWHAGIWYKGRQRFLVAEWVVNELAQRYAVRRPRVVQDELHSFPVMDDGTGMLQIDTAFGDKEVFIGNLLVSDHPEVCLTLVDRRPGRAALVVHNPTDQAVTCQVGPGPGFTLLGAFRQSVTVPAGSSLQVPIGK